MPTVQIRTKHAVRGRLDWTAEVHGPPRAQSTYSFRVVVDTEVVMLAVTPAEDRVEATIVTDVSDRGLTSLSAWKTTHKIPERFDNEVQSIVDLIERGVE